MTTVPREPDPVWGLARRLRLAGRGCCALGIVALVGFGLCVVARTSTELQSAVGVVSSTVLAIGYALQAIAHGIERRALDYAEAQRLELISSTTRRR